MKIISIGTTTNTTKEKKSPKTLSNNINEKVQKQTDHIMIMRIILMLTIKFVTCPL